MGRTEIANYLIFQLQSSVSRCVLVSMLSRIRTICNRCERSIALWLPRYRSDRVGAAQDLIAPVNPAFQYPYGNVHNADAIAQLLEVALANPVLLAAWGRAARQRMETCRFEKISTGP
jgi:hypothetical protein